MHLQILTKLCQSKSIILSKVSSLRLKEISRFSAKTIQMHMLCDTAAIIELCFAKIALTKNIQIISIAVGN
jgi:hypothetical protein